jgi:hypothetical protein
MFDFIANYLLPQGLVNLFKKNDDVLPTEQPSDECALANDDCSSMRIYPLSAGLGARKRTSEISGHWGIRGQEIYLQYKREKMTGNYDRPEISQSIKKSDIPLRKSS